MNFQLHVSNARNVNLGTYNFDEIYYTGGFRPIFDDQVFQFIFKLLNY